MTRAKNNLLAMLIAAAMLCSTSLTAFAAEDPSLDVHGTYDAGAGATPVIAFAYQWDDDLSFTYHAADKGTWNPETHEYEGASDEGAWSANGDTTLKVTNHSNVPVDVTLAWQSNSGFEDVKVGATEPSFKLATAEDTDYSAAPSKTVTLGVAEGALDEGEVDVSMGTLTLMVRQASEVTAP